jgi:hypothetical protein
MHKQKTKKSTMKLLRSSSSSSSSSSFFFLKTKPSSKTLQKLQRYTSVLRPCFLHQAKKNPARKTETKENKNPSQNLLLGRLYKKNSREECVSKLLIS